MEEHIESVGADREGIVKVNVRVVLYAFLFVIAALVTAVGVVFHWEAVGAPVARALREVRATIRCTMHDVRCAMCGVRCAR